MFETCTITVKSAKETRGAGASLAASVYVQPLTIALDGELGAGKTTFLQGFAAALGVNTPLASPTYALEQRYQTPRGELLHYDLYRLTPKEAGTLLRESDGHSGIRCIEWSQKAGEAVHQEGAVIAVHMAEGASRDERVIRCEFRDTELMAEKMIEEWRETAMLPSHIAAHCDAVAALAGSLADLLVARGEIVRKQTLLQSARLHDLFRFLDFKNNTHPWIPKESPAARERWEKIRKLYQGLSHEAACWRFLGTEGFPVHADIVATHGVRHETGPKTTEQKLLYYADKRVCFTDVVTLDERFREFAERYGGGTLTQEGIHWLEEAKKTEYQLFPDGPPL